MEQFKRVQVVMLPTENKAFIFFNQFNKLGRYNGSEGIKTGGTHEPPYYNNQHLYIISDNEIKKGDWFINLQHNKIYQCQPKPFFGEVWVNENKDICKKIIATTDKSLKIPTHYGMDEELPQPSQQFIEKYIESYNKGNIITDVLVEYEKDFQTINGIPLLQVFKEITKGKDTFTGYGLKGELIVKNEPLINLKDNWKLKINTKENTITIKKIKDSWTKEERNKDIHKVINHLLYTLRIKNQNKVSLGALHDLYTYSSNEINKWIEENL